METIFEARFRESFFLLRADQGIKNTPNVFQNVENIDQQVPQLNITRNTNVYYLVQDI